MYMRRYLNFVLQMVGAWGLIIWKQCHQDILQEWLYNPPLELSPNGGCGCQQKSGFSIHMVCGRPGFMWH
jgi:hypothetical protein